MIHAKITPTHKQTRCKLIVTYLSRNEGLDLICLFIVVVVVVGIGICVVNFLIGIIIKPKISLFACQVKGRLQFGNFAKLAKFSTISIDLPTEPAPNTMIR